jgi:hypothetical protein
MMFHYLAADALGIYDPTEMLKTVDGQQKASGKAMDLLWANTINADTSVVWRSLCYVSILLALFAVVWYTFYLIKALTEPGGDARFYEVVMPIIIALLLAKQGALGVNLALSMRSAINGTVFGITSSMINVVDVKQKIESSSLAKAALEEANGLLKECMTQQATPALYTACLDNVKAVSDRYKNDPKNQTDRKIEDLSAGIKNLQTATMDSATSAATKLVLKVASVPIFIGIINPLISAFASLYQYLMEYAMLGTALMLPTALAMGLMPGHQALIAWFTAMLSIGSAKLFYVIVVGWGAETMLLVPSDDFLFLALSGLGAPFASFVLASGGGLAIYSAMVQGLGAIAEMGMRVGGMR